MKANNECFGFCMVKPQHPSNYSVFFTNFKVAFLKFLNINQSPKEDDRELAQEVQRNADEVLLQLRALKDDLKHSVDGKLFTHVEDVVDPLAARIQGITKKLGNGKVEIQEFDHWINKKVRPFVESFSTKTDDKRAIEKAILKHMVDICTRQIDTDLKVIRDDQYHKLMQLNIEEEERLSLNLHVEEALAPIIQHWLELRYPPKRLTLENVNIWKREVDQYRHQYYHAALELIDNLIPDLTHKEELHESLLVNFQKIEALEKSVPVLIQDLEEENCTPNILLKITKRLDGLVQEAHHLELDLQLSPDLHSRLRQIKIDLNQASDILEKQKESEI